MLFTNISGEKIADSGYKLHYSLKEAVMDWYIDCEKKGLS